MWVRVWVGIGVRVREPRPPRPPRPVAGRSTARLVRVRAGARARAEARARARAGARASSSARPSRRRWLAP